MHAARLFDRDGYHSTSVEHLARAAGVSKGAIYHYFTGGKDEILLAIHDEFLELLLAKARARDGARPTEAIRGTMGDVLHLMRTHRGHVRVFFEHHRDLPRPLRDSVARRRDEYQALLEHAVARGVEAGELREVDPRLTALAIFGLCNWTYQWYRPDGRLSTEELADRFFDLVFDGLRRQR